MNIEKTPDGFSLQSEIWLPRPLDEVFHFFSDATNLQQLTPPFLSFEVRSDTPIDMRPGARIDYRLKLYGLPVRWQSEITAWDPPHRFVDEQRRGPYKFWIHEHRFRELDGGTWVGAHVHYGVLFGALVHRLFVRRDVERIFRHRTEQLQRLFGEGAAPASDELRRASLPKTA